MIGNLHYMSLFQKEEPELPYLCFTANTASTIGIKFYNPSASSPYNKPYYSLDDGATWTSYTPRSTAGMISLSPGQRICWKCNAREAYYVDYDRYYRFVMTGSLRGAGNIMSLIDGVGETLVIPYKYCFSDLFRDCTALTSAPALPATTLTSSCYYCMFVGCTSLTTAPTILPATTLAGSCYISMFYGCTSLTTAPVLPATTLATYCYYSMFYGCKALTTAPALPATALTTNCYRDMFMGCKALTALPALPATTLTESCYQGMFAGCSKIKLSSTQTGEYQTPYRIPKTGTGTTATSALDNMFGNTGGTFTGTPAINTTYYTSNTVV